MNRRELLKVGLASLGFLMLGDTGLFAAPKGWMPKKSPNIVFGVMSDTHMRVHYDGTSFYSRYNVCMDDTAVRAVLKYFRRHQVDSVLYCGDLTDRGIIREMEFYKEAWSKIFGDGSKPVNLIANGNSKVRAYGYNVEVLAEGKTAARKSIYANGYAVGDGYEPDMGVTTITIPVSDIPSGQSVTFKVYPCSSCGVKSPPLVKTERRRVAV